MKNEEEIISIGKISELIKNCHEEDNTFLGCLYDLYFFIGITKGIDDINNDRCMPIEEVEKEMEELYENSIRQFG